MQDTEPSCSATVTAVCKFTVACNRAFKQDDQLQKEVPFFDVSAWTWIAETFGAYFKKGRGVRVVGRLKQDRWTDVDGKPHSRVSIVAEHVEFKPQLKKQDGGIPRRRRNRPATRRRKRTGRPQASEVAVWKRTLG